MRLLRADVEVGGGFAAPLVHPCGVVAGVGRLCSEAVGHTPALGPGLHRCSGALGIHALECVRNLTRFVRPTL